MNRFVNQFLFATIVLSAPVLRAGPEPYDVSKEAPPPPPQPWCETPQTFEIRIGAPGWFPGLSGDVGVKGVVSDVDIGFDQIFRHLTHVPISLSVDVRYHRWEFFGDGLYMEVSDSATLPGLLFTNANVHLKVGGAGGFVGYRLINCDKASLSLLLAPGTPSGRAISAFSITVMPAWSDSVNYWESATSWTFPRRPAGSIP